MKKTLTILASPPKRQRAALTSFKRNSDLNEFRRFFRHIPREVHHLLYAASVESIRDQLRKLPARHQFHTIQLVGHGSPGILSLGSTWIPKLEDWGSEALLLDGDPNIYCNLLGKQIPSIKRVLVLGCSVGADSTESPRSGLHDGPTLLFDLARLFGVPVSAPVDTISIQDFDAATGTFKAEARLTSVSMTGIERIGVAATPRRPTQGTNDRDEPSPPFRGPAPNKGRRSRKKRGGPPQRTRPGVDGLPADGFAKVELRRLMRWLPISRGLHQSRFRPASLMWLNHDMEVRPLDPSPLLALPEAVFSIRLNEQDGTGELLANLTRLRTVIGRKTRLFEVPDATRAMLIARLSELRNRLASGSRARRRT
jgi:hypothetical protein